MSNENVDKEALIKTLMDEGMPREEAENFLNGQKVKAMLVKLPALGCDVETFISFLRQFALISGQVEFRISVPENRMEKLEELLAQFKPEGREVVRGTDFSFEQNPSSFLYGDEGTKKVN